MSEKPAPPDLSSHHLLLTGGTGFLGGHILNALQSSFPGLKITVFDLPPRRNHPKSVTPLDSSINVIHGDVTLPMSIAAAFKQCNPPPTIVIHNAGVVPTGKDRYNPSVAVRSRVWEVNVKGTQNVLDAAKEACVSIFVYTGSCTMITDDNFHDYPNYNEETCTLGEAMVYGKSKGVAEHLVLSASSPTFSTCSIRPSVILGPGDYQLVPTIHRCIERYETPFVVGRAQNLYDFTYVANVADAHALAVRNLLTSKTAAGQAFHISNGEPIPFRDFCLAIWADFGHVPWCTIRIPILVAWIVGWICEILTWLMGTEATLSRGSVRDYTQTAYADISKAKSVLGYEPRVSLADGIRISCKVGHWLGLRHRIGAQ